MLQHAVQVLTPSSRCKVPFLTAHPAPGPTRLWWVQVTGDRDQSALHLLGYLFKGLTDPLVYSLGNDYIHLSAYPLT